MELVTGYRLVERFLNLMKMSLRSVVLLIFTIINSSVALGQSPQPVLVYTVAWNSEGSQFAVGGVGLWIYDANLLTSVKIEALPDSVTGLAWSPDDSLLALGLSGDPNSVQVWDMRTVEKLWESEINGVGYNQLVLWNGDGTRLITLNRSSADIDVRDARTGEIERVLRSDSETEFVRSEVTSIVWNAPSNELWSANRNNTIQRWNIDTGEVVQTYSGYEVLSRLEFNFDYTLLAAVVSTDNRSQNVKIWDVSTMEEIATVLEGQFVLYPIRWHPSQNWLIGSRFLEDVFIFDVSTGEMLYSYPVAFTLLDMDISPYGGRIAFAGRMEEQPSVSFDTVASITNTVSIISPLASTDSLQAVANLCIDTQTTRDNLFIGLTENMLDDFVAEVRIASDADISPGCAADLLAVAEAIP